MKTFKQLQQNLTEAKSMVAVDKKNKMKYTFFYGQQVQYNGKPYETDKVANALVLHLKGRDKIVLTQKEIQDAFQKGKFKVIDIGNNPQHAVKTR